MVESEENEWRLNLNLRLSFWSKATLQRAIVLYNFLQFLKIWVGFITVFSYSFHWSMHSNYKSCKNCVPWQYIQRRMNWNTFVKGYDNNFPPYISRQSNFLHHITGVKMCYKVWWIKLRSESLVATWFNFSSS